MTAQDPAGMVQQPTTVQLTETAGWSAPGVLGLLVGVALVLVAIGLFAVHPGGAATVALVVVGVLLILAAWLAFGGLTPVAFCFASTSSHGARAPAIPAVVIPPVLRCVRRQRQCADAVPGGGRGR